MTPNVPDNGRPPSGYRPRTTEAPARPAGTPGNLGIRDITDTPEPAAMAEVSVEIHDDEEATAVEDPVGVEDTEENAAMAPSDPAPPPVAPAPVAPVAAAPAPRKKRIWVRVLLVVGAILGVLAAVAAVAMVVLAIVGVLAFGGAAGGLYWLISSSEDAAQVEAVPAEPVEDVALAPSEDDAIAELLNETDDAATAEDAAVGTEELPDLAATDLEADEQAAGDAAAADLAEEDAVVDAPPEAAPVTPAPRPARTAPPQPRTPRAAPEQTAATTTRSEPPPAEAPRTTTSAPTTSSAAATSSSSGSAGGPVEVKILSVPANARIVVDGKEMGYTNAKLELEPGRHTIQLHSGGETGEFPISVSTAGAKWCYSFESGDAKEGSCP